MSETPKNHQNQAILALEDGTIFQGKSCGYVKDVSGELVFNTGITGYQEIITDPSYHQQIVVFTYPHIGNVGTNSQDNESIQLGACGVVAKNLEDYFSNWRSEASLHDFLKKKQIPAISGIDTRKLTRMIRTQGTCQACLMTTRIDPALAVKKAKEFDPRQMVIHDSEIQTTDPYLGGENAVSPHIFVYDAGIKRSILFQLERLGAQITVVSKGKRILDILNYQPSGCVISNGPGDPRHYFQEIEDLKKLIDSDIPILGICLGAQLISLSLGAQIRKLPFGHHGINHPILNISSQKVYIVSQNHNYVIDEASLPSHIVTTHTSLFDYTIQGFKVRGKNIFAFQGHPEGGPGPMDLELIFSDFLKVCEKKAAV